MIIAHLAMTALLAASPFAAHPMTTCIWDSVPLADKSAFVEAYHAATDGSGMSNYRFTGDFLQARDQILMNAVSVCAKDATVPKFWAQNYVTSLFMAAGSSSELARLHNIKLETLEYIWSHAPQASFDCLKAHAGFPLRITSENCTNPAPLHPLLKSAGIDLSDKVSVQQAYIYFNARAGTGWGEYLVERYLAEKASGTLPPSATQPNTPH